MTEDYTEEKNVCTYLGLKVEGCHILAWYGGLFSDGGRIPTGWQIVCHISKLKMYLGGKIHKNHYEHIK